MQCSQRRKMGMLVRICMQANLAIVAETVGAVTAPGTIAVAAAPPAAAAAAAAGRLTTVNEVVEA
jgi:hypothetical protein